MNTSDISKVFSRVRLTYNLDDGEGDVLTEICIPNNTLSPVYGGKKIEVIHGCLSVYGGLRL